MRSSQMASQMSRGENFTRRSELSNRRNDGGVKKSCRKFVVFKAKLWLLALEASLAWCFLLLVFRTELFLRSRNNR